MRDILEKLQSGELSIARAEKLLRLENFSCLSEMAKLDTSRKVRTNVPEAVFAESKTPKDTVRIAKRLLKETGHVLVTRCTPSHMRLLKKAIPSHRASSHARAFASGKRPKQIARIGILAAGTSDVSVAEEARFTADELGLKCFTSYDVGVSGIHRLFPALKTMLKNDVSLFICAAGMEGTLPGLVASLVDRPVVGVPTSVGYGLGGNGIGALTTMLQSCAPGLVVVNINNGFGAAVFALKALSMSSRE